MRITMLTLSASPEGVLEAGRSYDVPEDVSRARALELLEGGCARQADPPAPKAKTPAAPDGRGGLERMTAEQLKAYAEENDLDLGGATKKADILEAIRKAETG